MLTNRSDLDNKLKQLILEPLYKKKETEKRKSFLNTLKKVLNYHYINCAEYKKICNYFNFYPNNLKNLSDIPYLTSTVFKNNMISSIPKSKVFRQINSSATTSSKYSKVILDKENNLRWTLSLQKMFLDRVGNDKYKILFLDTADNLKYSPVISARSSMLKSFLFVADDYSSCLNYNNGKLKLNLSIVKKFFKKLQKNEKVMIFGFTYVLYKFFLQELKKNNIQYNLKNGILVHAGGWKKLEKEKISRKKLNSLIKETLNISENKVIDIYGFSEQGGLLYPTCEKGFRHCTNYSTLIVRDFNFKPLDKIKKIGFLQFITPIQLSYPGNSFLTEDIGRIEGVDNCSCGRLGIYFKVLGRYKNETEIRGCGDIMSTEF
jgi:phenylacetate-coenzyme A ligase PaaK-like adenylate-forming protein